MERKIDEPPVNIGGFLCLAKRVTPAWISRISSVVFTSPPFGKALNEEKDAFFKVVWLGMTGAEVMADVVLWVATTLFGETTGSGALIPVARHKPPSVGGLALLPVSF